VTSLRTWSRYAATLGLLAIGMGLLGHAAISEVPEIDPTSGINAIALLAGALMVIRGRKR
jgi:hypothetical protein